MLEHGQPSLGLLQFFPQLGLGLTGEGVDNLVGYQLGRGDSLNWILVHESAKQLVKTLGILG